MEIPEVVCEVIGGKLALLLPAILKVLLRGQRGSEHEILTLLSSHIIFRLTANGLSSFNVCVCVCVPCVHHLCIVKKEAQPSNSSDTKSQAQAM